MIQGTSNIKLTNVELGQIPLFMQKCPLIKAIFNINSHYLARMIPMPYILIHVEDKETHGEDKIIRSFCKVFFCFLVEVGSSRMPQQIVRFFISNQRNTCNHLQVKGLPDHRDNKPPPSLLISSSSGLCTWYRWMVRRTKTSVCVPILTKQRQ